MPKKVKSVGMGNYVPSSEEQEAMIWCIDNRLVKMAPKAATKGPNPTEWHVDIWLNGKWNASPETYGPGEIWEKIYEFYKYYYDKYYESK